MCGGGHGLRDPQAACPSPRRGALHLPSGRPAGVSGRTSRLGRGLWEAWPFMSCLVDWGVPSGKGFILAPSGQLLSRESPEAFSAPRVPRALPSAVQSGPWGGWGQVEAAGGRWGQGAQAPDSVRHPPRLPQLACGVLWLSGYGPIWSQNATDLLSSSLTLLEQLGPTVSKLQGAPR